MRIPLILLPSLALTFIPCVAQQTQPPIPWVNRDYISNAVTDAQFDTLIGVGVSTQSNLAFPGGNTVLGYNAGHSITTARETVAIGSNACYSYTGIGGSAQAEDGLLTCVGNGAGLNLTSGNGSQDDIFLGQKAGENMVTAVSSTILGVHGADSVTDSENDTIIGKAAMGNPAGGNSSIDNVVVGAYSAFGLGNKLANVIVGEETATQLTEANFNDIVGWRAAPLVTTSVGNDIFGAVSAASLNGGNLNAMFGFNSGNSITNGSNNAFFGAYAGYAETSSYSTDFGFDAGGNGGGSGVNVGAFAGNLASGGQNVFIGANAQPAAASTQQNNVAVGYSAKVGAAVAGAVQLGPGVNNTSNSVQFQSTQIIDGNQDLHAATTAPASSHETCAIGAVRISNPYIYFCVATDTWLRATGTTF